MKRILLNEMTPQPVSADEAKSNPAAFVARLAGAGARR